MSEDDSFVDKWRARWPEWQVAEVFLPASVRARLLAWFALRQELLDAAWAGADPRPGEAKLAWWAEELQGWSQGRRRHPLGITLHPLNAPWPRLAAALPALAAARERAVDLAEARETLMAFAATVADIDAVLAGEPATPADAAGIALQLLAQRAVHGDDSAVPLSVRARLGPDASAAGVARAWADELLQAWPPGQGTRAGRIHAAVLRERLRRLARDKAGPPSRWRSLALAWSAARGRHSVPQP
jgi:hypothetical protein